MNAQRLSRRTLPAGWTPRDLPSGTRVLKRGDGWVAYWVARDSQTALVYEDGGKLIEERYPGKALPPCCA